MALDPRALALQGLSAPLSALALAVQGLVQAIQAEAAQLARVLRIAASPRSLAEAAVVRLSQAAAELRQATVQTPARRQSASPVKLLHRVPVALRAGWVAHASRTQYAPAAARRQPVESASPQAVASAPRAATAPQRAPIAEVLP